MSVEVISFGCRLNLAEGEAIRAAHAGEDDLIVINSCAVTAEAERQARQAIRRAAKRRPDARIVVTGCAVEVSGSRFTAMAEVSALFHKAASQRKLGPPSALSSDRGPSPVGGPSFRWDDAQQEGAVPFYDARTPAVSGADHARAFVEVQNGCDHDCTFCVITIARGASRSIPAGAVIAAVAAAVDRGQQEVVLTGIDLTSYGADLPGAPNLGMLVERILKHVPALPRLRLSSLDSVEIDDRLFELIVGEPRVMPHVHLSLQSGDDLILKRMKRRHSRAQAVALVARIKAKRDVAIGADLIAGFPTESAAAFANSLALLDDCDIAFAHIFPYSSRPGTAAARMPQHDRATVKARAASLREAAATRKAAWLQSQLGTQQDVLIELDGQTGHAPNFARVRLDRPLVQSNMRGTMARVTITGCDGDVLTGVSA